MRPDPVLPGCGRFIKVGAIIGLSSVVLVLLMGQPRIFFTMAHDGLLPRVVRGGPPENSERPYVTTIVTGVGASDHLRPVPHLYSWPVGVHRHPAQLLMVCISVLILRYRHPELPRAFRTPWLPYIPILGALWMALLMINLPGVTWLQPFVCRLSAS